ncbi:MAG: DUF4266 domain-containing protein [Gammaproteobacteria bacterium]|nr:DUF4266 domain-containing protein [Gammaproteobacteria bacterium]
MKPLFVFRIILISLCVFIVGGCESTGVESWERGILAQPDMQFQSRDLQLTTDDHFYYSKEGTSGGRGFAGGGCGCN